MKLEAGKSYRSREGEVFGPMREQQPNNGLYTFTDGSQHWTTNGSYYDGLTHGHDLIEEVPTVVNPEPDKQTQPAEVILLPCPKCESRNTGYAKSDPRKQHCLKCNASWTHGGPGPEPATLGDVPAPEPTGTLPTLHTADPFEALEWAERELEKRRLDLSWTVTRLCVPPYNADPVPGPAEGA